MAVLQSLVEPPFTLGDSVLFLAFRAPVAFHSTTVACRLLSSCLSKTCRRLLGFFRFFRCLGLFSLLLLDFKIFCINLVVGQDVGSFLERFRVLVLSHCKLGIHCLLELAIFEWISTIHNHETFRCVVGFLLKFFLFICVCQRTVCFLLLNGMIEPSFSVKTLLLLISHTNLI